jgi:translation initiation factor IF-3
MPSALASVVLVPSSTTSIKAFVRFVGRFMIDPQQGCPVLIKVAQASWMALTVAREVMVAPAS